MQLVWWLQSPQEYEAKKAEDPEFYRAADSLQYGKAVHDSQQGIDRMVKELNDRCASCMCII